MILWQHGHLLFSGMHGMWIFVSALVLKIWTDKKNHQQIFCIFILFLSFHSQCEKTLTLIIKMRAINAPDCIQYVCLIIIDLVDTVEVSEACVSNMIQITPSQPCSTHWRNTSFFLIPSLSNTKAWVSKGCRRMSPHNSYSGMHEWVAELPIKGPHKGSLPVLYISCAMSNCGWSVFAFLIRLMSKRNRLL